MDLLTRSRLEEILNGFASLRIGVAGDFNLDAYWYADMTRSELSREAPLYPRPVVNERYTPGGAANVSWNLAALDVGKVLAFTVLGRDWRRELLQARLEEAGVSLEAVVTDPGWSTPLFGKVLLTAPGLEQEDARLDFINARPLPGEAGRALLTAIEAALPHLDALVIADYHTSGVLNRRLRRQLDRLAGEHPGVIFVADSRENIHLFPHMVRKPNEIEAARLLLPGRPPETVSPEELQACALELSRREGRALVITRGSRGSWLFEGGECREYPAVPVPPPVDPVGAGDTFLAALAASLAGRATPGEACQVANLAASISVRCLRVTGVARPEQILEQREAVAREGLWSR